MSKRRKYQLAKYNGTFIVGILNHKCEYYITSCFTEDKNRVRVRKGGDLMGKNRRGRNIKKVTNWRGTCPICKRTGVKLLWTKAAENGTINVCKQCGNK